MRHARPAEPLVWWWQRWHGPTVRVLLAALAVVVVGLQVDKATYVALQAVDLVERDWVRAARVLGFAPVWLAAAAALALHDWPRTRVLGWWRGLARPLLLVMAIAICAAAAEVMKLLTGRLRPHASGGEYAARAWSDFTLHTGGLALPSSHATVAFAAAWLLCRLFPRATPVWLALATACGATRVLAQAHYVSDVLAAALLSHVLVALLWRQHLRNERWATVAQRRGTPPRRRLVRFGPPPRPSPSG